MSRWSSFRTGAQPRGKGFLQGGAAHGSSSLETICSFFPSPCHKHLSVLTTAEPRPPGLGGGGGAKAGEIEEWLYMGLLFFFFSP